MLTVEMKITYVQRYTSSLKVCFISVYLIVLKVSEQGPEEGSSMLFVGSDEGVHMAKQTLGTGRTVCVTSDHALVKRGKRKHTGYIYYTIP